MSDLRHTDERTFLLYRTAFAAIAAFVVGVLTYAGLWWVILEPLPPDAAEPELADVFVRLFTLMAGGLTGHTAWTRYEPREVSDV